MWLIANAHCYSKAMEIPCWCFGLLNLTPGCIVPQSTLLGTLKGECVRALETSLKALPLKQLVKVSTLLVQFIDTESQPDHFAVAVTNSALSLLPVRRWSAVYIMLGKRTCPYLILKAAKMLDLTNRLSLFDTATLSRIVWKTNIPAIVTYDPSCSDHRKCPVVVVIHPTPHPGYILSDMGYNLVSCAESVSNYTKEQCWLVPSMRWCRLQKDGNQIRQSPHRIAMCHGMMKTNIICMMGHAVCSSLSAAPVVQNRMVWY